MRTGPGAVAGPPTEPPDHRSRWHRRLPVLAALVGAAVFGVLAVLAWVVADQNEQRLLQRQTDQAAALLSVSIGQIREPLEGTARTVVATDADPAIFEGVVTPLLDDGFSSFAVYEVGSPMPLAQVGPPLRLLDDGPDAPAAMLAEAGTAPFVVLDLLDHERTLGFASVDDPTSPHYVVYAERPLSPDPNVRRRSDEPFSQLEYAIYLGDREVPDALLGASLRDLPIDGRRATTVIPYGDKQLLFVTTPIGRLGGQLVADLWWMVLAIGAVGTIGAVVLLRRLNARREEAVSLAAENARKHREQRDIAEVLQLSLLPERLTPPPGARLASRYWPAGSAGLIGGDFYDAFRIDDRHWGVAIGDVCGKGIEAAALTGLVRHTIRTAGRHTDSPASVLREVHAALTDHQPATFCTVCFITYVPDDAAAGSGRLTIALGGHPAPLLARGDRVEAVGQPGTILGMVEPTVTDVSVSVGAGDTLVLFTDGLTDAPGAQGVPMSELVDVVRSSDDDVEQLVEAIRASKRRRRPDGSSDDTAVLVLRFGTWSPTERLDDEWATSTRSAR